MSTYSASFPFVDSLISNNSVACVELSTSFPVTAKELENKDIYNKACITHRTFFRYYSDKTELLNDLEKSLINGLQSALIKGRNSLIGLKHEPDPDDILTLADPAFRHTLLFCDKYKRSLRVLVSKK